MHFDIDDCLICVLACRVALSTDGEFWKVIKCENAKVAKYKCEKSIEIFRSLYAGILIQFFALSHYP